MKRIVKGEEPASFLRWIRQNRGGNWNDFSGCDVYRELKQGLIEEQGFLCCYCEVALKKNTDAHIEHSKPKDRYPGERFSIRNLFACCQHGDNCGHRKGGNYFDELISPLDADCQSRFTYTGNGKIIPADKDDSFAQRTIDLLALNCNRLKRQRETIIKTLDHDDVAEDLLRQSLDNCIEWYNGFFTVIEYVAGKLGLNIPVENA